MKQVRKETLLDPSDLRFFRYHSSQMAALDYLVSVESDIFVPTYDGNMAKVVEGHRRLQIFSKFSHPFFSKISSKFNISKIFFFFLKNHFQILGVQKDYFIGQKACDWLNRSIQQWLIELG